MLSRYPRPEMCYRSQLSYPAGGRSLATRAPDLGRCQGYSYSRSETGQLDNQLGKYVVRPAREPAMTDVARLAGVSHQTVSRVLNDHPNVREQTRLRVQAAIHELGYRPNKAARLLVTGTSQVIGVVSR